MSRTYALSLLAITAAGVAIAFHLRTLDRPRHTGSITHTEALAPLAISPPSEALAKVDPNEDLLSGIALKLKEEAKSAADLVVSYPKKRPSLGAEGTYHPIDNIVEIEICEWIGYSGLLIANRGRSPNENSYFFKKHGFKVRILINETEEWDTIQRGKIAASVCTVDTLAAWGKELKAVCPLVFGWARFDDGLVTLSEVDEVSQFVGKTFVVPHFTQADFLIRHVAHKNGLPIYSRNGWQDPARPKAVNLVYATGMDDVGAILEEDLLRGNGHLAGCAGWHPTTTELVQKSKGRAKFFKANNLRVIGADIQVFNRGFFEQYPHIIDAIVQGTLLGNAIVNEIKSGSKLHQDALDIIAKALTVNPNEPWTAQDILDEFPSFDFANANMNYAFLNNKMTRGGSFQSMFEDTCDAYGFSEGRKKQQSAFLDLKSSQKHLTLAPPKERYSLHGVGVLARASGSVIDWSSIRFKFESGIYNDFNTQQNAQDLASLGQFLANNPQYIVTLSGSLAANETRDASTPMSPQLEASLRTAGLLRAKTIKKALIKEYKIEGDRIETTSGGWKAESPTVTVSVQALTLE